MIKYYDETKLNTQKYRPQFRKRMNQIIKLLEEKGPLNITEINEHLKISRSYLQEHLSYLQFDNKIRKSTKQRKPKWEIIIN